MSLEHHDVSAALQRIGSHLTRVASTHGLVPLSILAALSIAVEGGLFPCTPGAGVSAGTAPVPSLDLALSSQAARAADDRWQAARRVCQERQQLQELQDRARSDSVTPYGICVKDVLHARLFEDSML